MNARFFTIRKMDFLRRIQLRGLLCCSILWLVFVSSARCQQNISRTIPKTNTPVALFNGKNLNGWYTFLQKRGRDIDPMQVFTVKDEHLYISGEEWGCITTDDEYENYKLVVEYKWTGRSHEPRKENALDGGILLHSQGVDGGYSGIWMHGIECQIIEGGTGDMLVVGDGTNKFRITVPVADQKQDKSYVFSCSGQPVTIQSGRINWYGRDPEWKDQKGFRGKQDVEKSIGRWNRIECYVRGETIAVYVNGILVNYALDVRPSKGRIQLQSEGAEMIFRKIEITSLADTTAVEHKRPGR